MDALTSPAVVTDNEFETSDNAVMEPRLITPTRFSVPTSAFSVMDQFMLCDVISIIELGGESVEFDHLLSSEQVRDINSKAPHKCVAIGCRFCVQQGSSAVPNAIIIPHDFSEGELSWKIETELKCHCESCEHFPDNIRNRFDEVNDWEDDTPNHIWKAALQMQGVIEATWVSSEVELSGLIFDEDVFGE